MKLYRQKLFSSLGSDVIYEFLGRLSGFIHRAKTLHWSAKGKDIHEYLDGFWKSLYEFQDTVAEGWMGIEGKISDPFDIPCIPADELYPLDFIREVEKRVLDFYNLIPADDPRYKGLSGETESFIQDIEKYKYLFGLCYGGSNEEREFSEDEKKNRRRNILGSIAVLGGSTAGAIGGHRLLKKGKAEMSEFKNSLALEKAGKSGQTETLKNLWEAAKHAGDMEAHNSLEEQIQKAKDAIAEHNNAISKLEKGEKEILGKVKRKIKGGKALIAASIAVPIVYAGGKAIKNKKNNSKKENK